MKINNAVFIGLMGAISVVLGVAENFIPMPIPAIRLGLANVPIMMMMYLSSMRAAFGLLLLKSFLVPIFAGNLFFKLSLGLPSSLAAFVAMFIVIKFLPKYSTPISAGVAGAFTHMFVQILVASQLYIGWLWTASYLVGVMLLIATVSGVLTGILTDRIISRPALSGLFGKS